VVLIDSSLPMDFLSPSFHLQICKARYSIPLPFSFLSPSLLRRGEKRLLLLRALQRSQGLLDAMEMGQTFLSNSLKIFPSFVS